MADIYPRFKSWLGGHAGRIDPTIAPEGSWFGTNVQTYPSGLIGPRWGLKQVQVLDPLGDPIVVPVAGGPKGFAVIGPNLFVVADTLYMGDLSTLEATGTVTCEQFDAYPGTPAGWVTLVPYDTDNVYALVDGDLYQHVLSTLTSVSVTTPSTFSFIRRWGFHCVGIDSTVPYRLWFSEVSDLGFDFSTWPALNFVDIGDAEPITAIVALYNTLFVGKRSGWWALSGVIGQSTTVRQISLGDGPVDARGVAAGVDNKVAYWPRSPHPATFNGSTTALLLDHVTVEYAPTAAQAVAAAPTGRAVIFGYDDGAASKGLLISALTGTSYHEFGAQLAGWAPDVIENGYEVAAGYVLAAQQTALVGDDLVVYYWKVNPDRPALAADTLGSRGDDSDTPLDASLSTRGWIDPQGRDVRVRSVLVRFRAWDISDDVNLTTFAGFGVAVRRLAPYEEPGDTSAVQSWRAVRGELSADGGDFEVRFAVGEQGYAAGFQIAFTDMRGVAIRDVVVGIDLRGPRT